MNATREDRIMLFYRFASCDIIDKLPGEWVIKKNPPQQVQFVMGMN
jgi:hypothetical protein